MAVEAADAAHGGRALGASARARPTCCRSVGGAGAEVEHPPPILAVLLDDHGGTPDRAGEAAAANPATKG